MGENRHVLVFGGARGIGRAFVQLCLDKGWRVSVISRTNRHNAPTGSFSGIADICDAESMQPVLEEAVERHGPFHAVAFFQRYRDAEDPWQGHWKTSVSGVDAAIACLRPHFAPQGDKAILIISSSAALFVAPEQDAAYHASRAAQLGLMRHLAVHLGPSGIRVNSLSLGTVLKEENLSHFTGDSAQRERCESASPLRRMGEAKEIAAAAEFLCSPSASWITGQNILCDGGASLVWPESKLNI
jgi:NAD(P)-dependent dehydrogenase (short-subunit alcohol dehydrogenase family)